jgi:hypothetical protein
MYMWCLLLESIGNIQGITEIVTTMPHPNDLTVAMDGRTMAHKAISEEMVVEEMLAIVEDTDKE